MTGPRAAFCARLRNARERKGLTLDQIAASTKIARPLFEGLERGDVSQWPGGLYRRSYLRDYLRAIELSPDPHIDEFARLFPDERTPLFDRLEAGELRSTDALALTMACGAPERIARAKRRAVAAIIDAAVAGALWAVAWWLLRADAWTTAAGVAVGYQTITTMACGTGLGTRWVEERWLRAVRSQRPRNARLLASATAIAVGKARLVPRADAVAADVRAGGA